MSGRNRNRQVPFNGAKPQDGSVVKESGPQPDKKQLVAYNAEIINALLQYLDTRPHREVRGFIDELQKGQPVEL